MTSHRIPLTPVVFDAPLIRSAYIAIGLDSHAPETT